MDNCGFDEATAKSIEAKYHELYAVSDAWVADHITQAHNTGYVTAAFGLRVRTPLLKTTMQGASNTPYEASSEARTAGNALGQSWGLLNNRSAVEMFYRLRYHPYRTKILPVAAIHDAQYFLVLNDVDVVHYLNKNLTDTMLWNDDPLLYHPDVPLGGNLDIFYPDWSISYTLPTTATTKEILDICQLHPSPTS